MIRMYNVLEIFSVAFFGHRYIDNPFRVEELLEEEQEDDNLESYLFDDETDEEYEQTFDEDDDYLYSYEETLLDY